MFDIPARACVSQCVFVYVMVMQKKTVQVTVVAMLT